MIDSEDELYSAPYPTAIEVQEQRQRAAAARAKVLKIVAAVVVVLAAAGGVVLYLSRDDPAKHLARARAYIAANDHRSAMIELKHSLQLDLAQPAARVLLGRELVMTGDYKAAEIEFEKALDAGFEPERTFPLMVKALFLQDKYDKVINLVNNATLTSPESNAELQTLLGMAYISQNKPDEAMSALSAAKELVPHYTGAVITEARIRAANGQLQAAENLLDEIAGDDARKDEAMLLKGDIARALGQTEAALPAYQEGLKHNELNQALRSNLAETLLELGRMDEAQKQVDLLRAQYPGNARALYFDAVIAFEKKDNARARDSVSKSLHLKSADADAQFLAARIALASDQPSEAETYLRESLAIDPDRIAARKLLTNLYLSRQQAQKAEEALLPALAVGGNDPTLTELAARLAILRGDLRTAARIYDTTARNDPTNVDAMIRSATMQFAIGNADAGFMQLEAAANVDPNNPAPPIALVLNHLKRLELDKAMKSWKVLEEHQAQNPATYNLLASILIAKKDPVAARSALEKAAQIDPRYFPSTANLASMDVEAGHPDAAIERLHRFLELDRGNQHAYLALARIEDANGAAPETVLAILKEARKANPGSEAVAIALIEFYVKIRRGPEALALAEESLAAAPTNPRYLALAGELAQQDGKPERAVVRFAKLVSLDPDSIDYIVRLGQAQAAAGQGEAALASFRAAIGRKPDQLGIQMTTVASLLAAGMPDEASRLLFEITQLAPKSTLIPELDADIKLAARKYPEAIVAYRRALVLTPTPTLVTKAFRALTQARQRNEANTLLAEWLASHPRDPTLRLFDADVAMASQDYARAADDYRVVLQTSPDDPAQLNNLAWALAQQGDPQAMVYAEKAGALAPDNPAVGDTLGWLLVENGQTERGLDLIRKASAAAPQQLDIRLHLAKAQIKIGRKDDARITLQALAEGAPDSAEGKESKLLLTTM